MYFVMANLKEEHSPLFLLQAQLCFMYIQEGRKNKCPATPTAVYFLSVNSDHLKIKVNRLRNITANKAGLLFRFRLNTTAFEVAYIWSWKYVFVAVAICYFVVTDLYGNLKNLF